MNALSNGRVRIQRELEITLSRHCGKIGAVRSKAWICDFSSTQNIPGPYAGTQIEDDIPDLSGKMRIA